MAPALAVLEREEDLRTMAHDALDRWLDQLDAETATAPTLREISDRFMATRSQLLSACLETVIRQQYAASWSRPRRRVRVAAACGVVGWMRRRCRRCTDESRSTARTSIATRVASAATRWTRNWVLPLGSREAAAA